MFRSGYVSIVGRPNVGKSTLINSIMNEKLAIVSDKPQTTRTSMRAIYNDDECQIIFMDTPGIHKPKHRLGEYMVGKAAESVSDADVLIFMTEPDEKPGAGDKYITEMLKNRKIPKILVINKMDQIDPGRMAESLKTFQEEAGFDEIIPVSALKGKNIRELMNLIKKYLPEGPKYYPDDIMADIQERFIVSETVREKALRVLKEEVPHGIAVDVTSMKERENGTLDIDCDLITEKESHKPIIIGKGGLTLKKIGTYAREDLENFFRTKVNLRIFVKVRKDWRDNPQFLKELGYKRD